MGLEPQDLPGNLATGPTLPTFNAHDTRFIGLAGSLFVTAMGVNAFSQFVVPYLSVVRGWPTQTATFGLIVAFAISPLTRLAYPMIAGFLGDYGALLIGNGLYFGVLAVLLLGGGPLAPPAMGMGLGLASGLVFMAGPVQVMALATGGGASRASAVFWASNFLAWLIAIPTYGALISSQGLAIGPYAAGLVSLAGAVACALFTPRTRAARRERVSWRDVGDQLSQASVQLLVLLMFASSFSFGFMFGTFATYGYTVFGAAEMSFIAFGFYLARLPASLVAGWAAERFGSTRTLFATFGLATVAVATAALRFEFVTLLGATVALGAIQGALPVVGMASVTHRTTTNARSMAFAPIMGAAEFGVGVTLGIGLLLPDGNLHPSLYLGIVTAVYVACLFLLMVWRPTTTISAPVRSR